MSTTARKGFIIFQFRQKNEIQRIELKSIDTNNIPDKAGCWSYVGICPGCKDPNGFGYDVPSNWQVMNLSQACGYLNDERPVKHEFLHALGFLHEQSRPDRATFLDVDTTGLDDRWAAQFDLMATTSWLDTNHPYEAISVMHYGSSLGGQVVMTYKDGTTFSSGRKMTTTDALQLEAMYCEQMPQYQQKSTIACPTVDKFGFNRPVFSDRLCDNRKDCTNGEDEGTIAQCQAFGTNTANGCCEVYVVDGHECTFTGASPSGGGRDAFQCSSNSRYIYHWGGHWIYGADSTMDTGTSISAYITIGDQCPPARFNTGGDKDVICKVAGVLTTGTACDGDPCGANAQCFLTDDGHECQCNQGFLLDNGVCVEIVIENECELGTHNCDPLASCVDNTVGFTCICPEGTTGDGTTCESPYDCCKTILIDSQDDDQDHYVCEYAYTETIDNYMYYNCTGNPDYPETSWMGDQVGLLYDYRFGLEYFIHTPRKAIGVQVETMGGYGRQDNTADFTNQNVKKCPDMSIGWLVQNDESTTPNAVSTCAEHFATGFCETKTCPDNAFCTNTVTEGVCTCKPGFYLDADTDLCVEKVNECTNGTHNCSELAFCTDTNESFGCICDDGYDGDGVTCTIVCTAGTEPNAEGNQCVDIDECATNPCGANFDCINGNNQFTCDCDTTQFDLGRSKLECLY